MKLKFREFLYFLFGPLFLIFLWLMFFVVMIVKGSRRTAESSFEETIIMPDLQPQQQHGEKIVVEPEMEEQAPEPPVEVVPPRTTSANDHIHWPIPLINPLAV